MDSVNDFDMLLILGVNVSETTDMLLNSIRLDIQKDQRNRTFDI